MKREKLVILPKLNDCGGDTSKQWFVYYSVKNPATGKMERFRIYEGFTGKAVEEKIAYASVLIEDLVLKLRSGWTPFTDSSEVVYSDHVDYSAQANIYQKRRGGNKTLRVLVSRFLDESAPGIADKTFKTYRSKLRIFVLWTEQNGMANDDITAYTNDVIVKFFRWLIDDHKLSGRSIQKYKQILGRFFLYCKDFGSIKINPFYNIPVCKRITDHAPRPIMRADVDVLKEEIMKDGELWLAVQMEYYCALRPGHEIRDMKIKDIDFSRGTIRVDRNRAKNRRERHVTVPHQLLLQLRALYYNKNIDPEYYVFSATGGPGPCRIAENRLRLRFNNVRDRLNMPKDYKFYSWKHTGAIEADDAQISFKDISTHLGHTSMEATDFYFKNKKSGVSQSIRDNYPTL